MTETAEMKHKLLQAIHGLMGTIAMVDSTDTDRYERMAADANAWGQTVSGIGLEISTMQDCDERKMLTGRFRAVVDLVSLATTMVHSPHDVLMQPIENPSDPG